MREKGREAENLVERARREKKRRGKKEIKKLERGTAGSLRKEKENAEQLRFQRRSLLGWLWNSTGLVSWPSSVRR